MGRVIVFCCLLLNCLGNSLLAEPIKIGLSYPRTGNYKAEGLELHRGALMAVAAINGNGGLLGRPVQLLTRNSASRAQNAQTNVERFARQGAQMVFGGATSEEAIAAGQRARQLGLLYFATLSYANEVTGREGHRYLFRESSSALMSARVLGEYLGWHMPRQRYHYIIVDDYIRQHREYPDSAAASAYAIVQQWADAVRRSASLDSEKLIGALEDHRYSLLKGPQQWRAFDHQNVQSIYAVRVKTRRQIMQDPLKQDYFEIIHQMSGEAAAPSHDDWQQERGEDLVLQ